MWVFGCGQTFLPMDNFMSLARGLVSRRPWNLPSRQTKGKTKKFRMLSLKMCCCDWTICKKNFVSHAIKLYLYHWSICVCKCMCVSHFQFPPRGKAAGRLLWVSWYNKACDHYPLPLLMATTAIVKYTFWIHETGNFLVLLRFGQCDPHLQNNCHICC